MVAEGNILSEGWQLAILKVTSDRNYWQSPARRAITQQEIAVLCVYNLIDGGLTFKIMHIDYRPKIVGPAPTPVFRRHVQVATSFR